MESMDLPLDGDCTVCGHPFNPHVLVATLYTPELGGLIFCDQPGCQCQTTWSIEGESEPYIPDDDEVEHLREIAQSSECD